MTDTGEEFDALVESALLLARAECPGMTEEQNDAFRYGFVSGIQYVLRATKERSK